MTNKEAIKLIEHLKEEIVDLSDNEIQALDLAIYALEQTAPVKTEANKNE